VKSSPQITILRLIGSQHVIDSDGNAEDVLHFYGDLFGRLTNEVKNTGNLTRYVGYQSLVGGQEYLHFFGIEVDRITDIPDGMVAWDLSDSTWTVWEARDGQIVASSQRRISWPWLSQSPPGCGRCTGEFSACSPAEACNEEISELAEFWVSANAYVCLQECDARNDEVFLVDYDSSWPQQFDEIAGQLKDCLGSDLVLRVEHYGSTAIPGMPAKPVIDVLVEIPSFAEAKKRAVPRLNSEMWEYWWHSGHILFIKRKRLMGQRTHHIHMAPRGHKIWEGLAFRDYLRSHREEALHYAALKHELAAGFREDRERYTLAKIEYVQEVSSKALRYAK
jgi:GrpB-like predicted nucleotidyltransferase (UPF0157 family)/predicted transcriptional regulator YdeE